MATHLTTSIDSIVEAFEAAREHDPQANLLDYLPATSDPLYQSAVAELVRVDMEYSWGQGEKKRLTDYQSLLPSVPTDSETFQEIAYEEYRLRAQAGEPVAPEEYQRQYGISITGWSRWKSDTTTESSVQDLWQEALELAKDVDNLPGVGESFLGFSLQEEIGRGAFSHVFLAQQGSLAERYVVLKVASGNSLEPQHLARLQHTNIVPIYSVHRQEKLTAVCMPYFGKRTLADLLSVVHEKSDSLGSQQNLISTFLNCGDSTKLLAERRPQKEITNKTLTSPQIVEVLTKSSYVDAAIWLVKQIATGLAHAHERGIVHRDLKPANILLTDEGLPMLLDFNLSEDIVAGGRTGLLIGGTLPYMAPEHLQAVRSGGKVDFQTDIFSLGVIFFELLTGQRPFADRAGNFDEILKQMITDRQTNSRAVRDKNPTVPKSIEAVVSRCLAADPKQRYQTAAELSEDLENHLRNQPLVHAADRSVIERTQKWFRRHPRLSSAGGVATLAGCALAVLVGLSVLRGHRLALLEAQDYLQAFRQEAPTLNMALGMLHTDRQILLDGIDTTRKSLEKYRLLDSPDWREHDVYRALPPEDKKDLSQELAEQLYLIAKANERLIETNQDSDAREKLARESMKLNHLASELLSSETIPQVLLLQKATLLDVLGKSGEAEEIRQKADSHPSSHMISQYSEAYDLITSSEYAKAETLLQKLRDISPETSLNWLLLGNAKLALHKLHEAEGCYSTAISFEPDSYLAFLQRGFSRLERREFEAAQSDFEQVIALRPKLTCGYLNRALALKGLKKYKEAIADLTKALELGSPQTRIYFLRAQLRRYLRDTSGAAADTKIGLQLTPSDELSWVARGVAKLKSDPEAALADFQQALQLNPLSVSAHRNCVHVLADRLEKPEQALESIRQLLQINQHDSAALAGRAVIHARSGDRDTALADVQQLLRISKEPQSLFQAACALSLISDAEKPDLDRALTLLSRAVLLEPRWFVRAHTDPDLKKLRETEVFQSFAENTRKINRMRINLDKPSVKE